MKNFRTAMAIGAALALLASPVAFAQKTLRVATLQGAAQPSHKGLVKMAELVKERTNGALTIQVFGDGQLGTEQESIEGVQLGTIDMFMGSAGSVGPASTGTILSGGTGSPSLVSVPRKARRSARSGSDNSMPRARSLDRVGRSTTPLT